MTQTLPDPADTSTPTPSRRQLLAFLALADLPVPQSIRFSDEYPSQVSLTPGDNRDLTPLMVLLGAASREVGRQRYDREENGRHGFILTVDNIRWRGWQIDLGSFADDEKTAPDVDLDYSTRAQLAVLAEAGADR